MINHIMLGMNDVEKSRAFYDAVLGLLGADEPFVNVNATGQTRLFYSYGGDTLSLTQPINGEPVTPSNGFTLGFKCESAEQVTEIHDIAVANGGASIEDPPGLREGSMGPMYLSYFTDPNGHKLCGIYRPS